MVITNLQEKQNRKVWVPIRGGNRGGWSLFNWQDVREMPYKDRQMYLGNSVTVGVLDKGGKWRKRDWYNKTQKKYQAQDLKSQQQQALRRDYQRMSAALGIQQQDDQQKLTQQQMRQLMKKIKMKKQGYQQPQIPNAIGLGFDKMKVQIRAKPSVKMDNPHKLQAFDQLDKLQHNNQKQKIKKQKKDKKQKKQKKQKKKKHKQHKQHQDRQQKHIKKQEQNERSDLHKKSKKDKHKKKQKQHSEYKRHRDRSRSEQKRKRRHSSSSSSRSD